MGGVRGHHVGQGAGRRAPGWQRRRRLPPPARRSLGPSSLPSLPPFPPSFPPSFSPSAAMGSPRAPPPPQGSPGELRPPARGRPPCPRPLLRARLAGPCPCLTRGVLDGAGRGNTSRLSKTSSSGLLHLLCTLCCFRPSPSISPHELEGRDSPHYSPRFLMKHSSSLQYTSCRFP